MNEHIYQALREVADEPLVSTVSGSAEKESLSIGDCALRISVDTSSLDKFLERVERAAKAAREILNEEK